VSSPASRRRQRHRRAARQRLDAAQYALDQRQAIVAAYELVAADMAAQCDVTTLAVVEALRAVAIADCEKIQAEVVVLVETSQQLDVPHAPTSDPETTLPP